jgi:hypothetical protein
MTDAGKSPTEIREEIIRGAWESVDLEAGN